MVHRRLFGQRENREMVDALTDFCVAAYRVDPERVRAAAYHRVQAMMHSDRWVTEGRREPSPLLAQVEDELIQSYASLREATTAAA